LLVCSCSASRKQNNQNSLYVFEGGEHFLQNGILYFTFEANRQKSRWKVRNYTGENLFENGIAT